jgi:hypothetical protein
MGLFGAALVPGFCHVANVRLRPGASQAGWAPPLKARTRRRRPPAMMVCVLDAPASGCPTPAGDVRFIALSHIHYDIFYLTRIAGTPNLRPTAGQRMRST